MHRLLQRKNCLRVSVVCALLILAAPSRAGEHQSEFIPEFNGFFKLSDDARLFLLGDVTKGATRDRTDAEFGVHLDLTLKPMFRPELRGADWERIRYLWIRAGIVRTGLHEGEGLSLKNLDEKRGILEATARVPLADDVWLVNRGRVDLRDIDGDSSRRYRYRLGIEREFTTGGVVHVPYAQAETFYDTRFNTWSRQVYQFGSEIEFNKHWRIEPYYSRQNDTRSSPAHIDRVGLVLKYYR